MKESYLENARTVQAGPVSSGNSQHPQGKKVAGAEKSNQHRSKLEPESTWSNPYRALAHKQSRPVTRKKLSRLLNQNYH